MYWRAGSCSSTATALTDTTGADSFEAVLAARASPSDDHYDQFTGSNCSQRCFLAVIVYAGSLESTKLSTRQPYGSIADSVRYWLKGPATHSFAKGYRFWCHYLQ